MLNVLVPFFSSLSFRSDTATTSPNDFTAVLLTATRVFRVRWSGGRLEMKWPAGGSKTRANTVCPFRLKGVKKRREEKLLVQ